MRARPEPLIPTSVTSRRASELRAEVTAQEAARTPAGNPYDWVVRMGVEIVHKADRDRLLGLAAETAFFAVLTLFPAMLVATSVLGQLQVIIGSGNAARVEQSVLEFLDTVLTDTASPAVETVRQVFDGSGSVLTIASLLALFSLATAFSTLVNTVNIVYDVAETRGWWRRRFLGLLLGAGTVLTGALAVTLLVIGPLFGRAEDLVANVGLDAAYSFLWSWLREPVAFLALVAWATTMQHFGPAKRSRWRHDLPGGLLTTVLWLAASYGLNLYVSTVVTTSPVFGALGGGLILMTWFYLLCASLLIGAEMNAILLARRRHRARTEELEQTAPPPPDPEDPGPVLTELEAEPAAVTSRVVDVDRPEQERVPTAPRQGPAARGLAVSPRRPGAPAAGGARPTPRPGHASPS